MSYSGDKETQKTKYYQKNLRKEKETAQTELYLNKYFVSKLHIYEVVLKLTDKPADLLMMNF